MSAPLSSRCVAKACLNVCGVAFLFNWTLDDALLTSCCMVFLLYLVFLFEMNKNPVLLSPWIFRISFRLLWRKMMRCLPPFAVLRCISDLSKSMSCHMRFLTSSSLKPA